MEDMIRMTFNDAVVPFVAVGVSGTIFAGPFGEMAYRTKVGDGWEISYIRKPDKESLNYRLNKDLIDEAVAKAYKILISEHPEFTDRM